VTTNAIAAPVTMTTTPAASMVIPIFSTTSLKSISLPADPSVQLVGTRCPLAPASVRQLDALRGAQPPLGAAVYASKELRPAGQGTPRAAPVVAPARGERNADRNLGLTCCISPA
jgi:hypothetical protein